MSRRCLRCAPLIALLALIAAPRTARAQVVLHDIDKVRSPQHWAFELRFGPYSPDVDSELDGATPHRTYFGEARRLMSQLELDYQFFHGFGSLAVGASIGYFRENAGAFVVPPPGAQPTDRSADNTRLSLYPISLLLIYRMDEAARRLRLPLVPYGKLGLNYTFWSIYDGNGDVAEAEKPMSGRGRGGTGGWQASAGVAFMLDVIDPGAARELDGEIGVNHTYVFVEATKVAADGLGKKGVLHVGDTTWMAGLMFEF
jgi:hypothetical protein